MLWSRADEGGSSRLKVVPKSWSRSRPRWQVLSIARAAQCRQPRDSRSTAVPHGVEEVRHGVVVVVLDEDGGQHQL